jgi:predicted NBD/HSP70 family sugar kinase
MEHDMGDADRGPARLRRLNAARVLDALRAAGTPLLLNDLSEQAHVSRSSIESLVAELVDLGLVTAASAGEHRGPGRPARAYSLRVEAGVLIGMDIGAHRTTALVSSLDGVVRGRAVQMTTPDLAPRTRLDGALEAVREALDQAGLPASAVDRIHVGTAGIVDRHGSVTRSGAITGWDGVPLSDVLGTVRPDVPVRIDNDVRFAALAEQRTGVAAGYSDVLHVHLGTRAAAAIIIGGRAHIGHGGSAAEVGFLPAPSLGPRPGPAGPDPANVARVLSQAEAGQQGAVRAVEDYVEAVTQRIAPLITAIAPEAVVLGGGLIHARDLVISPLMSGLAALLPAEVPVLVAAHGESGTAQGALYDAAASLPSSQILDTARTSRPIGR